MKIMRKVLLSLVVGMCCLMGNAQNKFNLSEVKSVVNFGIDYSLAKVYGGKIPDTNIGLRMPTSMKCSSPSRRRLTSASVWAYR